MLHWINHHGVEVVSLYFVFNCAVSQLPVPTDASGAFYRWLYGFAHGLLQFVAGNLGRVPGLGAALASVNPTSQGNAAAATPPAENKKP